MTTGKKRVQRFDTFPVAEFTPTGGMNSLAGTIKDRCYMGGEVSYFIERSKESESHIISMMRTRLNGTGERVSVDVAPHHCQLIPVE